MVFQNDPMAIKRYAPFHKPLDAPTAKIDDAPYVCIQLNEQWLPFVIGAIETLRWPDLYKGTPEQIQFAALEATRLFLAIALGNIECPEEAMPQLRQNPLDPCQLQVSYDGGETWSLAFDYSLCMQSETVIPVSIDDVSNFYDESTTNFATYAGDITNVYNNWGYGDADDVYRDDAMCWAVKQWVDLCCGFAIELINTDLEEEKDTLRLIAEGLTVVGGMVASLVSFGVFPVFLAAGALAFTITGAITDVYAELVEADTSTFENEEARQDVACIIYAALQGGTPNFTTWKESLYEHGLSGDAAWIARVTRVWMQSEESFVEFFKMVGDMIDVSKAGANLGCVCTGEWSHWWYPALASGSEPHETYDNDAPQWTINYGSYDLQEGGFCSEEVEFETHSDDRVELEISFSSRTITSVQVEALYTEGFIKPGSYGRDSLKIYLDDGSEEEVLGVPFAFMQNGQEGRTWNGNRSNITRIRIMWRCSYSENIQNPYWGDGDVIINKIVVSGKVDCPFD